MFSTSANRKVRRNSCASRSYKVGASLAGGIIVLPKWAGRLPLQILRFYGPIYAWGVMIRGLRTEAIIRPPRAQEFYLCHIGVREDLRGHGIGTHLVRNLLEGLDAGRHRCATLDVAVTNPRAQLLYERLRFVVSALRKSTLKNQRGRVVDHCRMSLPVLRR
jgi:ribosomal protein S18 acetylase RimI-like enzyme